MAGKPTDSNATFTIDYGIAYGSPTMQALRDQKVKELRENSKRWDRTGFGVSASNLGHECDRKLFLDLCWVATPTAHSTYEKLAIFERGNWEEDRIIAELKSIEGITVHEVDPQTGKQFEISLANGLVRGRTDGEVEQLIESNNPHVLEIKSMKDSDWKNVVKKGLKKTKPEHWYQLLAGMESRGIERGLYICRNKATEQIHAERVKMDKMAITNACDRVTQIAAMNDMPVGSFDKKKTADQIKAVSPCFFCPYQDFCYGNHFPMRSCRSCVHRTLGAGGSVACAKFGRHVDPKSQRDDCPSHLMMPTLVPGEVKSVDEEAETITYTMPNGSEWTDGGVL